MKVFNCILGVFSIFASIYCMIAPGIYFLTIAGFMVGILLGVLGFCSIFEYARNKNDKSAIINGPTLLIFGIAATVLSTLTLFSTRIQAFFDLILVLLLAAAIVITGVTSIADSIKLKKTHTTKAWWLGLVWGIILIICGCYAGTHIAFTTIMFGYILAAVFMVYGIRLICSVFEKTTTSEN